jgi:hypothetical protein
MTVNMRRTSRRDNFRGAVVAVCRSASSSAPGDNRRGNAVPVARSWASRSNILFQCLLFTFLPTFVV